MSNPSTRQRLPVELRTLDIRMIRCLVRGPDRKLCALVPLLVQVECDLGKQGTSKDVDSISRTHRIKPHCTQDIPRGHLADIVIPADAVHVISIGIGKDTANPLLRKPGFACIDKQVGGMVGQVHWRGCNSRSIQTRRGSFQRSLQVAWKTFPRPPIKSISPGTSWGTNHVCCSGLLSVHPWPNAVLPCHGIHSPLAFFARMLSTCGS